MALPAVWRGGRRVDSWTPLRKLGFSQSRVRHHGDVARLEIGRDEMWKALNLEMFDALLHIDNYEGATGRLAFDRKGDVVQYPRLYVVQGGQLVAYDRFVESGGALPVPGR